MYSWGYIKNVALAKLDLDENEAEVQNLITRFQYYLNEVITQVSSSIKPDKKYYTITIYKTQDEYWKLLCEKYPELDYDPEVVPLRKIELNDSKLRQIYNEFWAEWDIQPIVNNEIKMPKDFISFADDVNYTTEDDKIREAHDYDFDFLGRNSFVCYHDGIYRISYNARWHIPDKLDPAYVFDIPTDILDCVPSYIASQCYKIDDEYKAAAFRNEYEMFLARIDDTDYKNTKTFTIGGDW